MGSAGFKYGWRKMEVAAQERTGRRKDWSVACAVLGAKGITQVNSIAQKCIMRPANARINGQAAVQPDTESVTGSIRHKSLSLTDSFCQHNNTNNTSNTKELVFFY